MGLGENFRPYNANNSQNFASNEKEKGWIFYLEPATLEMVHQIGYNHLLRFEGKIHSKLTRKR